MLLGEAFNLTNHPNYGSYTTDITSPAFGQPAQNSALAYAPREFQLAARFEFDGITPEQMPKYVAPIREGVKDKGPGGHVLTGPVAVEGAEVGDVLEVEVLKIDL